MLRGQEGSGDDPPDAGGISPEGQCVSGATRDDPGACFFECLVEWDPHWTRCMNGVANVDACYGEYLDEPCDGFAYQRFVPGCSVRTFSLTRGTGLLR